MALAYSAEQALEWLANVLVTEGVPLKVMRRAVIAKASSERRAPAVVADALADALSPTGRTAPVLRALAHEFRASSSRLSAHAPTQHDEHERCYGLTRTANADASPTAAYERVRDAKERSRP